MNSKTALKWQIPDELRILNNDELLIGVAESYFIEVMLTSSEQGRTELSFRELAGVVLPHLKARLILTLKIVWHLSVTEVKLCTFEMGFMTFIYFIYYFSKPAMLQLVLRFCNRNKKLISVNFDRI